MIQTNSFHIKIDIQLEIGYCEVAYHRRLWCLPVKSATAPRVSDNLKDWKGLPANFFGTLSFAGPQPVGLMLTSSVNGSADAISVIMKPDKSIMLHWSYAYHIAKRARINADTDPAIST